MTTFEEAIALLRTDDLTLIGMRADARRRELNPDSIVTYCPEDSAEVTRVTLGSPEESLDGLDKARSALSILPVCNSGATATEYLRFVAVCRLYSSVLHIELDPEWSGLKVAQIALRFGADDFGSKKPSPSMPEEEIRRTIREAGLIPKRRDRLFRSLSLY